MFMLPSAASAATFVAATIVLADMWLGGAILSAMFNETEEKKLDGVVTERTSTRLQRR